MVQVIVDRILCRHQFSMHAINGQRFLSCEEKNTKAIMKWICHEIVGFGFSMYLVSWAD